MHDTKLQMFHEQSSCCKTFYENAVVNEERLLTDKDQWHVKGADLDKIVGKTLFKAIFISM